MTTRETDGDLDTLLAELRGTERVASSALQARVLADAAAQQALFAAGRVPPRPRPLAGLLRQAVFLFGGGGALAGMSLAAAAGIFIGVAQPAPLSALTQALLAEAPLDDVDLWPAANPMWTED